MRVPKCLATYRCALAFPQNGSANRQDLEKVGTTLVDWQRGMVHCVLISIFEISRIIAAINFIL